MLKIAKKYIALSVLGACSLMMLGGQAQAAELKALSEKQASIVTVAAFTAQGDLARLKPALGKALDAGLTVNETSEVLMHLYAYAGFPKSLNGLNTLVTVLRERKASGIEDVMGPAATPVAPDRDRLAIGKANQERVAGRVVSGPMYELAPFANTLLREHLFGDLFERDVLSFQERELATVGALAGIGNVNPQLRSHMRGSMNVGVTGEQLQEAITVLGENVDQQVADNAQKIFDGLNAK